MIPGRKELRLGIRAAFIFATLAVVFGSVLPTNHAATASDKMVHFAAYGLISILASFAFSRSIHRHICLATIILFGAFLEVVQNFVPGRSCELYDVVANSLGVLVAFVISNIVLRRHNQSQLAVNG